MNTSNDSSTATTPADTSSNAPKNAELCTEQTNSQPLVAPNSDFGGSLSSAEQSEPRQSVVTGKPTFSRCLGETPRAFNAFTTYFRLGHSRSLQGVADKLGEQLPTVKNCSSKYDWSERINQFNSGLLEQQAQAEAEATRKAAADWARRTQQFREQEWESAQKLLALVQCCLENFGDRELEKIRLSELSRALNIASKMSHSALRNTTNEDERPALAPIQNELLAALSKISNPSDRCRCGHFRQTKQRHHDRAGIS